MDFLVYGVYFIKVYIILKERYKYLNFGIEMKFYMINKRVNAIFSKYY